MNPRMNRGRQNLAFNAEILKTFLILRGLQEEEVFFSTSPQKNEVSVFFRRHSWTMWHVCKQSGPQPQPTFMEEMEQNGPWPDFIPVKVSALLQEDHEDEWNQADFIIILMYNTASAKQTVLHPIMWAVQNKAVPEEKFDVHDGGGDLLHDIGYEVEFVARAGRPWRTWRGEGDAINSKNYLFYQIMLCDKKCVPIYFIFSII